MQVFITYTRKRKKFVGVLAQDLRGLGHEVWFDRELTGGQDWWNEILKRIRECELYVLVLAPDTLDSEACTLEAKYASDLGKRILPIRVEPVSRNLVPDYLDQIQYVDYASRTTETTLALVNSFRTLPEPRELPDPLPDPPPIPGSYLRGLKEQIESTEPLSEEQQNKLFLDLAHRLREGEDAEDARKLLIQLRKRDGLLAKVGDLVDAALAGSKKQSAPRPTSGDPAAKTTARSAPAAAENSEEDTTFGVEDFFKWVGIIVVGLVVLAMCEGF